MCASSPCGFVRSESVSRRHFLIQRIAVTQPTPPFSGGGDSLTAVLAVAQMLLFDDISGMLAIGCVPTSVVALLGQLRCASGYFREILLITGLGLRARHD